MSGCINCYKFELPGGKKEIVKTDGLPKHIKLYATGLLGLGSKEEIILGIEKKGRKNYEVHIFEIFAGALSETTSVPVGKDSEIVYNQISIVANGSAEPTISAIPGYAKLNKKENQIVVKKL